MLTLRLRVRSLAHIDSFDGLVEALGDDLAGLGLEASARHARTSARSVFFNKLYSSREIDTGLFVLFSVDFDYLLADSKARPVPVG